MPAPPAHLPQTDRSDPASRSPPRAASPHRVSSGSTSASPIPTTTASNYGGTNGTSNTAEPLLRAMALKLLTDGYVDSFADLFAMMRLDDANADHTPPSGGAVAAHALWRRQVQFRTSPAHVQRLCKLLAGREDAVLRADQADSYTACRALAAFLLDAFPVAAARFADEALSTALSIRAAGKVLNAIPEPEMAVVEARVALAEALAKQGNHAEAIAQCHQALVLPNAVDRMIQSVQTVAEEHEAAGQWAAAHDLYGTTLAHVPPTHPRAVPLTMDLHRRLGRANLELGQLDAARPALEQYLEWAQTLSDASAPREASPAAIGAAVLAVAECRDQLGDLEGAMTVLRAYLDSGTAAAVEAVPARHRAAVMLGNLLNRMGHGATAAGFLQSATDDASCVQLGIARGTPLLGDLLAAVNAGPQAAMAYLDQVRRWAEKGGDGTVVG
ncbi:hypothetical protein AMAG_04089 [Allomyces macrogynus ATCC 38327]|uniref:Tetratricopeptide repeat protein 29 n=1 Tax=Allomyces macrogynus (strain ATCC 38327) TaxID=578462 RepID=A0A0L0S7R0_ALLM3|nr:hypothetical protein AMAG_04089 [Allomyces macrogynus ATCC 38327]|eukprot:KNE58522.1 hypothetical protein AMAG_04089 [Allomyces macrogynus ATCC 38327]